MVNFLIQKEEILNKLCMHIKRGEKIALFVWLVLTMITRFYDLDQGSLRVEGQDIRLLNLPVLSSAIGVCVPGASSVQQVYC